MKEREETHAERKGEYREHPELTNDNSWKYWYDRKYDSIRHSYLSIRFVSYIWLKSECDERREGDHSDISDDGPTQNQAYEHPQCWRW